MKRFGLAVLTVFWVFFAGAICVFAAEESFPKIGFAKSDGVNVRAGDNVNFETLCKLKQGDPVKITDKRYSWFKIELPKTAYLYIKNEYVDLVDEKGAAEVNAKNVNLRAGPDTKYSIVGQISKPDKVNVLAEGGGWFKIEPPAGLSGWIHSDEITFEMEIGQDDKDALREEARPATQEKPDNKMLLKTGAPEPKGNLIFSNKANR